MKLTKETIINKATLVPLAYAFSMVAGGVWIDRRFTYLENVVKTMTEDRYSINQASEDALREALANPGHSTSDPRNPGQFFRVESEQ